MKISKKYSTLLFGIFIGLAMSFFMSFFLTLVNIGLSPDFFARWGKAFILGFLVALPTSLIVTPIIRKIVNKITSG